MVKSSKTMVHYQVIFQYQGDNKAILMIPGLIHSHFVQFLRGLFPAIPSDHEITGVITPVSQRQSVWHTLLLQSCFTGRISWTFQSMCSCRIRVWFPPMAHVLSWLLHHHHPIPRLNSLIRLSQVTLNWTRTRIANVKVWDDCVEVDCGSWQIEFCSVVLFCHWNKEF